MLNLTSISKRYGTKTAIDSVSGTIKQGELVCILGTNGSGKSTLLNIIGGTLVPDAGTITYQDRNYLTLDGTEKARIVGRMLQSSESNCVLSMTIAENCALADCKGRPVSLRTAVTPEYRRSIQQMLDTHGIRATADTLMSGLSGGQRQLICFLMATRTQPQLLLLDEPTAALDPAAATRLLMYVKEYTKKHGVTTLMITHDPAIAHALATTIWILDQGQLRATYSADQVSQQALADVVRR